MSEKISNWYFCSHQGHHHRFTDNLDPEQLDTIIEIKDFNFEEPLLFALEIVYIQFVGIQNELCC